MHNMRRMMLAGILVCAVIGIVLAWNGQANATWYYTHGNNASVEDEHDPAVVASCVRKGTGLEIVLNQGDIDTSTWVHFAVPTPVPTGVKSGARFVKVRVNMVLYAGLSKIISIKVYNGETLVKEFPMDYRTAGWNTIQLDLGGLRSFSKGMGVSVKITQDFNSGGESFTFSGAGANFTP